MYFMQVGVGDEGPLLPALKAFKISMHTSNTASGPNANSQHKSPSPTPSKFWPSTENAGKLSIAQLFSKFVQFYGQHYNWRNEAISIRLGRRAPPGLSLPLHVVVHDDGNGTTELGPTIEDPFNAGVNLG